MKNTTVAFRAIRKFVFKHRVALAIAGTATVFAILNSRNAKLINEFLLERGINPDEFWTPEA
jgi:hypothetical protein